VPVADAKGRPQTAIQASYADYVWGLPPEADPLYPSLGLSTREGKGEFPLEVIDVPKTSVAGRAGFQVGDVLQSMDGTPLKDRETLNVLLAEKRWADDAVFVVSRGGSPASVKAVFRRELPQAR
jgi:S1-C subfamily serine protease